MSKIPTLEGLNKDEINREILRIAIIAELDAVNLYEQLASLTDNGNIKKIFLDIAKEEKTHIGEFQALLLKEDAEQAEELVNGKNEVNEKLGGE